MKFGVQRRLSMLKSLPLTEGSPRCCHDEQSAIILGTDDDLIQAAQSGDHEAFAELCRRHGRVAKQRILAIVRNQEDAEDAMQETLLRAYTNLRSFRQACKFSTWITAIGTNAALTVIRKKKSRRESEIEPYNEPVWDIADQAPDPEHRIAKTQIILLLRGELHDLPQKMREAVSSYYGHDYSLQEAADTLGISIAAVKSRLSRGRRSLKSSLKRKGLLASHL
jgi:RNA polymerase sigma-70 factor, ECF subfamily